MQARQAIVGQIQRLKLWPGVRYVKVPRSPVRTPDVHPGDLVLLGAQLAQLLETQNPVEVGNRIPVEPELVEVHEAGEFCGSAGISSAYSRATLSSWLLEMSKKRRLRRWSTLDRLVRRLLPTCRVVAVWGMPER